MSELVAYSTFVVTIALAVGRPRVGTHWRIGPGAAACAGMLTLLASGIVTPADLGDAARTLWRPFVTIVAIMTMTAAARRLGVLDVMAERLFGQAAMTPWQLFLGVFVLGAITATLLNNDAAVLLLTPLVLPLVARRYPQQPELLLPFAFAVFMSAGVAPFVVSNPMNMIVAGAAGIDFNAYAARMVPISIAGSLVGFLTLQRLFATPLMTRATAMAALPRRDLAPRQVAMLVLLVAVLGGYPAITLIDGSALWLVSVAGAAGALLLVAAGREPRVRELVTRGVAWEVLVFLVAVFVIAIGLRKVGLVAYLAAVYVDAGVLVVGTIAAVGSALLNNHPMAIVNLLALNGATQATEREILAALIGGDLGPRLLPIGSLAGLLWLESCRRLGVEISLAQFVGVGVAVTVPTLAVSLALLALL